MCANNQYSVYVIGSVSKARIIGNCSQFKGKQNLWSNETPLYWFHVYLKILRPKCEKVQLCFAFTHIDLIRFSCTQFNVCFWVSICPVDHTVLRKSNVVNFYICTTKIDGVERARRGKAKIFPVQMHIQIEYMRMMPTRLKPTGEHCTSKYRTQSSHTDIYTYIYNTDKHTLIPTPKHTCSKLKNLFSIEAVYHMSWVVSNTRLYIWSPKRMKLLHRMYQRYWLLSPRAIGDDQRYSSYT